MTENKSKCQRCNQEATKSLGLTKEGEVVETLMLCDSCYQKEVFCQECGKEDESKMPQEVEKNGQKIKVCQDCKEKLQKANLEEIIRKARKFKEQMKVQALKSSRSRISYRNSFWHSNQGFL